jgi:phi LC3 family holin
MDNEIVQYLRKRWRNYGFWISLASAVLLMLTAFGLKIDNEQVMTAVKAVLGTLTVLGIVNDPTTTTGSYADDKEETSEQ